MGILIPEDFDLRSLKNDAERSVVARFRDELTDGWLLIPSLKMRDHRDYEIDLVVMHRDVGIFIVEVKGHKMWIEQGLWRDDRGLLDPQPLKQAQDNSYKLRDFIRDRDPNRFRHLIINYAVALPNTSGIRGDLPVGLTRDQILTAQDLDDVPDALARLRTHQIQVSLTNDDIDAVIRTLAPNVDFDLDPAAAAKRARQKLEKLCAAQVRALERLDANRRVVVTGGAGTGKTRLALAWARRANVRGERVLLTCFNEPLADQIKSYMYEDENLVTGSFLKLAMELCGLSENFDLSELSASETKDYWDIQVVGNLHREWPNIEDRFDTIIVDEAQDFSPAWIAQLESLLDPDGPRRIMLVGDSGQDVFDRGFHSPRAEDGWTVCELVNNSRNSIQIAQILRRVLMGAPSPMAGPESIGIEFLDTAVHPIVDAVRDVLTGKSPQGVTPVGTTAVITGNQTLRDQLRRELGLGSWEERAEKIVCESPRRLKGTEFDTVILVDGGGDFDQQKLYVAVSRAISQLVVIGPTSLGERLGLI
jgi:thymidine kinase